MKIKGILGRIKKEYCYYSNTDWTIDEMGKFWDTVKDYDEIDDETYAYKRRFYDSLRMLDGFTAKRALDIDCRTGNGSVFFHENKVFEKGICMTPSDDFLRVCRERIKKYNVKSKASFFNKLPLKLKDEDFDLIIFLETIEHIPPRQRLDFLKELNRVLKKDGKMILSMPNILWEPVHWIAAIFYIHHSEGPHRFLGNKVLHKLVKDSGFIIEKEETTVIVPSGPNWLIKLGELFERVFKNTLLPLLGLRRIYILKKR